MLADHHMAGIETFDKILVQDRLLVLSRNMALHILSFSDNSRSIRGVQCFLGEDTHGPLPNKDGLFVAC